MKRRDFLRNFGLVGAVITVPTVFSEAATRNLPVKKDISNIRLKGKVHSNGKGLASVSVTDGYNVTQTDKNGNYELLSNNTVEFVYISVPAGYAFNHDNHVAQFYRPVQKDTGNFKADFELQQLAVDDQQHVFVVWADTQMISQEDVDALKAQTVPDLQALVAGYPKDTLFHGIGCGDLVWDKFELFDGYRQAIDTTGVTFFNVIGNHDMDLDARTDELSAKTFKKLFGPTYYSYNRGNIHYVVLDDVFFIGTAKKYIGYITEDQLQWLEQDLAFVQPGTTVVVSLHIPTNTGAAKRNKKEEELGSVVSNRQQLYKILKPYTVHFMSGHTHFNDTWEKDNMMEHNHGTVCGAWWTGPVCGDGTPKGYGVYEVNGNDLKWYYKSTGHAKMYQFSAFGKGRSKDFPEDIVANVWNWDSKWKVEWLEDGVEKGPMLQRVSLDPTAVDLYAGPELPKKHRFVDPTLTEHLFFAQPSPQAKKVEIKVTDRFGNVYRETLNV